MDTIEDQCRKQNHLGRAESLRDIIEQDAKTLDKLKLKPNQFADVLRKIFDDYKNAPLFMNDEMFDIVYSIDDHERTPDQDAKWKQWRDLDHEAYDTGKKYDLGGLSAKDFKVMFDGKYMVHVIQWKGFEDCPYQPWVQGIGSCGGGSKDIVIRNNKNGKWMRIGELLIHQIEDHHFFQGKASRYRVDPQEFVEFFKEII
jgi:hypothetical protein